MSKDGSVYTTPEGDKLVTALDKATYLRTVQDWIIAPQLRSVKGVAGIDVLGGYVKEYAVHPDPAKLAAYGVGLVQLVEALEHQLVAGIPLVAQEHEGAGADDLADRRRRIVLRQPLRHHEGHIAGEGGERLQHLAEGLLQHQLERGVADRVERGGHRHHLQAGRVLGRPALQRGDDVVGGDRRAVVEG